ncbi:MAG: ABC transporter substrate-binding protein [Acidimicrobiia bacterium]
MKRMRWLVLVAVLAVVAAACGTSTTNETTTTAAGETTTTAGETTTSVTPEPSGGGTIIIGTTDTISSMDPADAYAVHDWELIKNTGEPLLRWKPGTAELEPGLATDFPEISDDGLTYTFTLRDGIQFADGTDLTAQVYADQVSRLLTIGSGETCPNNVAGTLAAPYVESIEAPDDSTVVFHLLQPVAYFPQILAGAPYVPSSPANFPADECVLFPEAPIYGVGPWYISSYTQSEQTVLEPNPYYTGDLTPKVDQIIIKYFSDPQTMALAVQNGEIDVAWRILGPELSAQMQDVEGLTVGTVQGGSIRYLILNHTMAPFDDSNVRKAVASLIDRDEISDVVYGGQVEPLYSMVPPGFLGSNEAFDSLYASPNVDAALGFLADSGYDESNHLELTLWYPPEHYGANTAEWMGVIEQQLEASGVIDVTLQAQEWSTYVTALTGGEEYPAGVLGWFFDYPDPSNYLEPFIYNGGLGTNVAPAAEGSTVGEPIDELSTQLLDLVQQGATETDQASRADIYGQAQDVYADEVVTLPLFFEAEHVVFPGYISGDDAFASPETLNIGPTIEFNYSLLSRND